MDELVRNIVSTFQECGLWTDKLKLDSEEKENDFMQRLMLDIAFLEYNDIPYRAKLTKALQQMMIDYQEQMEKEVVVQ